MATLAAVYEELGAPAPTALFVAARKRGLNVTREQARQFTMRRASGRSSTPPNRQRERSSPRMSTVDIRPISSISRMTGMARRRTSSWW
jgi:hypothetical protein